MDTNHYLRAMVLMTLPYPPLPVNATRIELDDNRLQDEEVTTSHTFIAKGFEEASLRNDAKINAERKIRQQDVMREFLHAMAVEGFFCDYEHLYLIYCRYTFNHIATYFPPGQPIDVRFQPHSYVVRGDKCHAKMAEYLAAQSVFHEDCPPVTRAQYLCYDFPDMLCVARDRLGHAMTPEERVRAEQMHALDESRDPEDDSSDPEEP